MTNEISVNRTLTGDSPRNPNDAVIKQVGLYFLPVTTRVPLKFGHETLTSVTCARVRMEVADQRGRVAEGWGETPLSVQWAWPSSLSCAERFAAMTEFCRQLTKAWCSFSAWGHPLEIGADFQSEVLTHLVSAYNRGRAADAKLPLLAALVCASAFDIALHDAYGNLHDVPTYQTYTADFLTHDLAEFLTPAVDCEVTFRGMHPADFLQASRQQRLPVWHLVGGLDPLNAHELTGQEPSDGYPVLLEDWIERDGLYCLKVKLRGNDANWDYGRLVDVGQLGLAHSVRHLSADFNCTVQEPAYVNEILDRLAREEPAVFDAILYVEQPFAYELDAAKIDVRSVTARKPLFLDESAHNWQYIALGRSLGWNGVALKTCKTQTGAILSMCWARAHDMQLMVQDLTNPMLAQIPHVLLAAHANTIMGVESNAMQFYPEASTMEAQVHPGLYARCGGELDLSSIRGSGFGYRVDEIKRRLPEPDVVCE